MYSFKEWFLIILICLSGGVIFLLALVAVDNHSIIWVVFLMCDVTVFVVLLLWASTIKS